MNNSDDKLKIGRDWIAFVVAWISYSVLTYRFWHNVDDAFISFRYAKNWAMGYGPRYNLGPQQPEEGYSNFLWVVVCTFIEYLELDIPFWAPMLGFACGSLLLYLVFRTLRRDFGMGLAVGFFLSHEPTILRFGRVDGPPPDRENPEYPLARRIRLTAESWRQWGPGPIWRRYAPEILPLKPSPDGSRNALLILRLIEEAPHITTLPRPERIATRKRRARKAWGDFFAVLDSALIEGNN